MDDLNQLEKATYLDAGNTTVDENGYQYTYDYEQRIVRNNRGQWAC